MTNPDDPRHDPEAALKLIKRTHLWGPDLVAPEDADDATKDLILRANEERSRARAQESARWAAGRFYLFEAAKLIATQRGLDQAGSLALLRDMLRSAELPDSHKHKLTARQADTLIPVPPGVHVTQAAVVYVRDVNDWLDATGAGYAWGHGTPSPAEAPPVAQRAASVKTHRIAARDLMAPVIDRARRAVGDPEDSAAVMAELERLARLPEGQRPPPLADVNSAGVRWRDGGRMKTLTRKALGMRLKRR